MRKTNQATNTKAAFSDQFSTTRSVRRTRSRKSASRAKQAVLVFRTWGGARKGAGRKPKGERPLVSHSTRPVHKRSCPVLVTTRLLPGLPSLRHPAEAARVRMALASARAECGASRDGSAGGAHAAETAPFQVVHHSIQSNHLHLIVEATDRRALSGGMRVLLVRIARALNRLWGRRGSVFADRFHERALLSPRQVRNALVYVLQNLRKHGICLGGPDPYSSAPEFDGWCTAEWLGGRGAAHAREPAQEQSSGLGGSGSSALPNLRRAARAALPSPKTWLLREGWQRHGLIDPREAPRAH